MRVGAWRGLEASEWAAWASAPSSHLATAEGVEAEEESGEGRGRILQVAACFRKTSLFKNLLN